AFHTEKDFQKYTKLLTLSKKYTDSIKKRVAQYDKDNHLIAIYDGVRVAERATGVSSQAISKVAKHQKYRKTAGGYRWEFV
ncbi:MAG: hypothetical protein ACIRZV_08450, partial [Limosilactobacillus mucosae]